MSSFRLCSKFFFSLMFDVFQEIEKSAQSSVSNAQIECKYKISVDNLDGCVFFVEQTYVLLITTRLISTLQAICLHISNRFPFVTNSLTRSFNHSLSLSLFLFFHSNSIIIVIAWAFYLLLSSNKQDKFSRFCKTIAYCADVDLVWNSFLVNNLTFNMSGFYTVKRKEKLRKKKQRLSMNNSFNHSLIIWRMKGILIELTNQNFIYF